jgi:hypothetical protein
VTPPRPQPRREAGMSEQVVDELGYPVTQERIDELLRRYMFLSDTASREIGLVVGALWASRSEDRRGLVTENTALARELEAAQECHVEQRERANGLASQDARLRAALIHTRRMVMMHHALGECPVCASESGRKTWDEGDAALSAPDRAVRDEQ